MTLFRNKILFVILAGAMLWLPACEKALGLDKPETSPVAIFDETGTVLDQKYALFSVKGTDWQQVRQQYRSMVNDGMSQQELFHVLDQLLETLKDGHVTLISDFDTATYENFYKLYPINFNYNNLVANYLKNDYGTNGPVIFKIVDNVGYIYYRSFESAITDDQANSIMQLMSNTKGLIIDIRSNTGGRIGNVDRLFSHFITDKKLVKYEQRKNGPGHDDLSEPEPYYVSPAGQAYSKPVVVLTNRSCFSACNDFVLYMSNLPNVQLMGDQTGGGGAVPQDYLLANGWKLRYSATRTLGPDKQPVENGIQPDITIFISPIDETNGKDPILERAFNSLR